MALKEGEPADPADVWMRILTRPDYIRKDGKVHNRAFTGTAIAPPSEKKPYSLEFSGRLLSLTKDVEKEGSEFCKPPMQYSGIMYQHVAKIRTDGTAPKPGFRMDVVYTPNNDKAHADVVAFGPSVENKYLLRDWLQDVIQFAAPGQGATIEKLRIATDTAG